MTEKKLPAGRPKGSKNKITLLKLAFEESARDDNAEKMRQVVDLVIQQALQGDFDSQKLVWQAVISRASSDDKTQAQEKLTIQINTPQIPKDMGRVVDVTPTTEDITDD